MEYEARVRSMATQPGPIDPASAALLVVDVANDVAHPDGAFARQPDVDQSLYARCVPNLLRLIDACSSAGLSWIAVHSAYDADYLESPMRDRLSAMGVLGAVSPKGAWGSDVIDQVLDRRPTFRVLKSHFSPLARHAVCWRPGSSPELDDYLSQPVEADSERRRQALPTLIEMFDSGPPRDVIGALDAGGVAALHDVLTAIGVDTLIVAGGATHVCLDATVSAASALGYRVVEPFDATGSEDAEKHWAFLHNHGLFTSEVCTTDQLIAALSS